VNELVDWLRTRPYYNGQIAAHRTLSAREAATTPVDLESRLDTALANRGIVSLYIHQVEAAEAAKGESIHAY